MIYSTQTKYSVFLILVSFFFFFNDTATTEIYTLSLHDALPISGLRRVRGRRHLRRGHGRPRGGQLGLLRRRRDRRSRPVLPPRLPPHRRGPPHPLSRAARGALRAPRGLHHRRRRRDRLRVRHRRRVRRAEVA